jgi:type 1 fimbria pilin
MRPARPTLLAASLLAVLGGCMDITGSGHPLTITGTVTVAGTTQPVANATVEVYSNPFIGQGYLMETAKTDGLGRFTVRIEEQRTYARPNCAAMSLWVSAAGYADGSPHSLGTAADPSCESGSSSVTVEMTPIPVN